MYGYYRYCNEARDRIERRQREAEAERTIHQARAERRRRRRARLRDVLEHLSARRRLARPTVGG